MLEYFEKDLSNIDALCIDIKKIVEKNSKYDSYRGNIVECVDEFLVKIKEEFDKNKVDIVKTNKNYSNYVESEIANQIKEFIFDLDVYLLEEDKEVIKPIREIYSRYKDNSIHKKDTANNSHKNNASINNYAEKINTLDDIIKNNKIEFKQRSKEDIIKEKELNEKHKNNLYNSFYSLLNKIDNDEAKKDFLEKAAESFQLKIRDLKTSDSLYQGAYLISKLITSELAKVNKVLSKDNLYGKLKNRVINNDNPSLEDRFGKIFSNKKLEDTPGKNVKHSNKNSKASSDSLGSLPNEIEANYKKEFNFLIQSEHVSNKREHVSEYINIEVGDVNFISLVNAAKNKQNQIHNEVMDKESAYNKSKSKSVGKKISEDRVDRLLKNKWLAYEHSSIEENEQGLNFLRDSKSFASLSKTSTNNSIFKFSDSKIKDEDLTVVADAINKGFKDSKSRATLLIGDGKDNPEEAFKVFVRLRLYGFDVDFKDSSNHNDFTKDSVLHNEEYKEVYDKFGTEGKLSVKDKELLEKVFDGIAPGKFSDKLKNK